MSFEFPRYGLGEALRGLLPRNRLGAANRNTPIDWSHNAAPIQTHRQDLFCHLCFNPLLLHGLQAHFLVNLFEPSFMSLSLWNSANSRCASAVRPSARYTKDRR